MSTNEKLDAIYAAVDRAGEMTAQGNDGIMYLGKVVYEAIRAQAITSKAATKTDKADDVRAIYERYLRTANSKSEYGAKFDFNGPADKVDSALKTGASKLRTFAHFAALKGDKATNWKLVGRVVTALNEGKIEGQPFVKTSGSRYEQTIRVLRFAKKQGKAALTNAQLAEAFAKAAPEPVDHPVLEALEKIAEKIKREMALVAETDYFQRVLDECDAQIAEYTKRNVKSDDEAEMDLDEEPEQEIVAQLAA